MRTFGHFIDGRWTDFQADNSFVTKSPATGEVLAAFTKGTRQDVRRAIEAAEKALPQWKRTPAPKRGEILLRAADLLRQRKDELGAVVTREMGKVLS